MNKMFQNLLKKILIDVGWLKETLFCYQEISELVNKKNISDNFFILNTAFQYHHSMVIGVCRLAELLKQLLQKLETRDNSKQEKLEINTEKKQLQDTIEPVKIVRDKVIAHSDKHSSKFGDLHFDLLTNAIEYMLSLTKKYDKKLGLNKFSTYIPAAPSIVKEYLIETGEYKLFECIHDNFGEELPLKDRLFQATVRRIVDLKN